MRELPNPKRSERRIPERNRAQQGEAAGIRSAGPAGTAEVGGSVQGMNKPRCWNMRDPDTLYLSRKDFCQCRIICEQAV